MEGLGGAASIIAVVDISAKIIKVCFDYYQDVSHAKEEIKLLQEELENVQSLFKKLRSPLQNKAISTLSTLPEVVRASDASETELRTLAQKLDIGKRDKAMHKFGFRALKWPFSSGEVEQVIERLGRHKQTIILCLQVDQRAVLLDITQKLDLGKLPQAKGAALDSFENEHERKCHAETRIELLRDIYEWGGSPSGRCIFWLTGRAGTGKSTIARTVAEYFTGEKQLVASFFFKRGEGDRGNATKFVSTLTTQLICSIPSLIPHVAKVLEDEPDLPTKRLITQFQQLLINPLSNLKYSPLSTRNAVVVIDALDECERSQDIETILLSLAELRDIPNLSVRVFITSRPDLPILDGIQIMDNHRKGAHQDVALHEIPEIAVKKDLSVYLRDELATIRSKNSLPDSWPSPEDIETLAEMAQPLFIFAATTCRFIGDGRLGTPQELLVRVLKYKTASQASKLKGTYRPVLDQLLMGLSGTYYQEALNIYRKIIGTIVLLAEPLSRNSCANLLGMSVSSMESRLKYLHSVLNIPADGDTPIHLHHLSFRNFLMDDQQHEDNPFQMDERLTHQMIAARCLEIMSTSLKENICELQSTATARSEVENTVIASFILPELQYACSYWIYHLKCGSSKISDQHEARTFIEKHFLYWLETLSLIGKASETLPIIVEAREILQPADNSEFMSFLYDAERFILANMPLLDMAPLQIYYSALIFAPTMSLIRTRYRAHVPEWIRQSPEIQKEWSAVVQTMEGHTSSVSYVTFSPDGKHLASASRDKTVRLWDGATGQPLQTLPGHGKWVTWVAFSPDGIYLASASRDKSVRVWDTATGRLRKLFEGHKDHVTSVSFSSRSSLLASASLDKTICLWDIQQGQLTQVLETHGAEALSVAFSPDGSLLASGLGNQTIQFWNTTTWQVMHTINGSNSRVVSVAFSPDSKHLASASEDVDVHVWDVKLGTQLAKLSFPGRSVAFSPDGRWLASSSNNGHIILWNTKTEQPYQLGQHDYKASCVAFSPDSKRLASSCADLTVRLWNIPRPDESLQPPPQPSHHITYVAALKVSPDGKQVASAGLDGTVRLWSITGQLLRTLQAGRIGVQCLLAYSPDGKQLACNPNGHRQITLWDVGTGEMVQKFKDNPDIKHLEFSNDNMSLVTDKYVIPLDGPRTAMEPSETDGESKSHIELDDSWIKSGGHKAIWLPREHRGTCSVVSGNWLVVGQRSGQLHFWELHKPEGSQTVASGVSTSD